jgi:hypothetical protein
LGGREIAALEDLIRAEHGGLPGLCLAPAGWSAELRMFLAERKKPPGLNPAAVENDLRQA